MEPWVCVNTSTILGGGGDGTDSMHPSGSRSDLPVFDRVPTGFGLMVPFSATEQYSECVISLPVDV